MTIRTRPLTADTFGHLEHLFAQRGCSFARACWCMDYRIAGKVRPPDGLAPRDHKKALMRELAAAEPSPGLIGYDDEEEPVGWVTFGPREDFARLKNSRVMRPVDDLAVWAVVCFVVPSPHRGRGIAAALLRHAVDHAREQGAAAMEGFPIDKAERSQPQWLWHGTKSMFDAAGFREIARRTPQRPVMRRSFAASD